MTTDQLRKTERWTPVRDGWAVSHRPLLWRKRRLVVVAGDMWDGSIREYDTIDEVLAVMAMAEKHKFIVSTAHPDEMKRYMDDPAPHWSEMDELHPRSWHVDEFYLKLNRGSCPPLKWPLPNVRYEVIAP